MNKNNATKSKQLGMSLGKASGILRKKIMFWLVCETGRNKCHRCGKPMIEQDISIEHKIDWQYSGKELELFLDLDNISFSHKSCNVSRRRSKISAIGVCYSPTGGHKNKPWIAEISKNYNKIFIGRYKSKEQAISAYQERRNTMEA